ncbi:RdgB/HAM1 family non-canonical purine NTP pyrophosphatase [Chryseolinea sp. H1M3-3]|uniref:RdgB/HAM1 family non-canonical purine NTP pyrophosphatase n=1 Tax=Chryseolinea sp. H1M3-3 TaxID=3034144 RepID=UPI0023EC6D36|nr:RdgB/HAM1 family non-canonical purine NTP pyrophosphatase [Chryseolinea sp. H1M3-3]
MKLCFATNNKHKLEEAKDIAGKNFEIVSLEEINCFEELPETRPTLEGNSLQKAEYVFQKYNVPCFADDTGLEVEALHGEPGVFSARYAGEHKNSGDNIALLLKNLGNNLNRKARFRTIITLIGLEEKPLYFEGEVPGIITAELRGKSGFGYDPIFIPEGYDKTYAEMSLQEKSLLSHRAIAVKKLEQYLRRRSAPQ